MKTHKVYFWISTGMIFLFEGVMPALTFHSPMAREGIRHLGYPQYFGYMFVAFKVLGALSLIIPRVPARVKEWAYAGFGIDFICALVSLWVVDGIGSMLLLPVVAMLLLAVSYINYHRIKTFAVS